MHRDRMHQRAEVLEAYTGVASGDWFQGEVIHDDEMPGGGVIRTAVRAGACVFLDRERRGCSIHRFCTEFGIDYHELKSVVDCLFPLSVMDGVLCPANELDDGTLVCSGTGLSVYRGLRGELAYYFGPALLEELDQLEREVVAAVGGAGPAEAA